LGFNIRWVGAGIIIHNKYRAVRKIAVGQGVERDGVRIIIQTVQARFSGQYDSSSESNKTRQFFPRWCRVGELAMEIELTAIK
jgi:hypothetical protein